MTRPLPQITAPPDSGLRPRAVAVVLAGPEPALLARCLGALALQRSREGLWLAPEAFGAVVAPTGEAGLLRQTLQALGPALPFPIRAMPPGPDGAWTLRAAMAMAADWLGGRGAVLVTSTEAVPEPGWVAHGFAALSGPADAVLGEVVMPGGGPDAAARYAGLLAALAARLDPDPASPAPAHGQADAASFGIRAGLLAELGGLPAGPGGGLPGLLAALGQRDGRLRRLPGMRVEAERPPAPVEPALAVLRRLRARRCLREFWVAGIGTHAPETPAFRRFAARLGLQPGALGLALATPCFGEALAAVEALCPALAARPLLQPSALPGEMLKVRALLAAAWLRGRYAPLPPPGAAQRAGGPIPGGSIPGGSCMVRYPAGGWNRAGSWGS